MMFRDLKVGQRFEFDRSGMAPHLGACLMSGPWVKTGDHNYQREGLEHEYRVGVRTVAVIPLPENAA